MKKFFLFASAALVLASCSSEAEEAVIKPNETPEEEVLELTEIKLGAGAPTVSAETRAANEVNDWTSTPQVGIFGVNENASATENDWTDIAIKNLMGITEEKAVILLNEPATVSNTPTTGTVSFDAGTIYFPRGNSKKYGYTFLGYYPYIATTPTNPTASADTIKVKGKFDGTQDIMAGKAASATTVGSNSIGYNAKYIRDYKAANSSSYPNINIAFEHLTSKIDILLQQGSSYMSSMCDVYAAWFEVEEDYTLTFAKPTSGNGVNTSLAFAGDTVKAFAIGGGDFDPAKSYNANDIVRYNSAYHKFNTSHEGAWTGVDVSPAPVVGPESSASTKHTIFVTPDPQNSGTTTKTLYLVLNDDPSIDIPVIITSPDGGFEAGKAYEVKVTINGPEEIKVTASIVGWTTGGSVGAEI